MGNGLVGAQGPIGAQAATGEAREVSLNAVRDDVVNMQEQLAVLDQTVQRLQEHLMGAHPTLNKGEDRERADRPPPSGALHSLCELGSSNLHHLHRIQERLNQLCYELGEGR